MSTGGVPCAASGELTSPFSVQLPSSTCSGIASGLPSLVFSLSLRDLIDDVSEEV